MGRNSFLVSLMLVLAAAALVAAGALYFDILPGGGGVAKASPTAQPSGLVVPTPTPPPTPLPTEMASLIPTAEPTPGGTYVVQSGDSLSIIGDKFGIPWLMIAEANGIAGPDYIIQVGQELTIPTLPQPSDGSQVYVVQSGDTITAIAAQFSISATDLADFNSLVDWNAIRPGDLLYIPGPGWTPRPTGSPAE